MTRPVEYWTMIHRVIFNKSTWQESDRHEATWLAWGLDYEELGAGAGAFSTAIIQLPDGSVLNIPCQQVRFLDTP